MSKKTAGLLVGGALIIVALGVYGASKIHIVKQDTQQSSQTQKNVEVNSNNTGVSDTNADITSNSNTNINKSDNKTDNTSTKINNNNTDNSNDMNNSNTKTTTTDNNRGWQEINEDSINYNVREMTSGGVIVSKTTYLDSNNQLLYRVGIQIGVGSDIAELSYYCTYNAYSLLNVDDIVTVKYKQVTDTVYAITLVSKDN